MGCLLWRNYIIDIQPEKTQIYFTADPVLIQALESLGYQDYTQKDTIIIVRDKLFDAMICLIRYAKHNLASDKTIGQSRNFVRGIRDTMTNGVVLTKNRKLILFLEKYIWYWFEQKIQGITYRITGRRRLYSIRITP
jgi:hypothetical protein